MGNALANADSPRWSRHGGREARLTRRRHPGRSAAQLRGALGTGRVARNASTFLHGALRTVQYFVANFGAFQRTVGSSPRSADLFTIEESTTKEAALGGSGRRKEESSMGRLLRSSPGPVQLPQVWNSRPARHPPRATSGPEEHLVRACDWYRVSLSMLFCVLFRAVVQGATKGSRSTKAFV